MKVEEIMTANPRANYPDASLAAAAAEMWRSDCGCLPVVDRENRVVGMITDRDICMAVALENRRPGDVTVGEVAGDTVYACRPDDDVTSALDIMRSRQVRRLPVVDKSQQLVGVLSLNDVTREAANGGSGPDHTELVKTMQRVCEHRDLRAS